MGKLLISKQVFLRITIVIQVQQLKEKNISCPNSEILIQLVRTDKAVKTHHVFSLS